MTELTIGGLIQDLRGAKRFFRPDWDKRIDAAHRLGELRAADAADDLAAVIDENENADLCLAAVQALGQIGGVKATDITARLIGDKARGELHAAAITALQHIGDERAVAALIGSWAEAGASEQAAVERALVQLGPDRTSDSLVAALGDPSPPVRQVARSVLRRIERAMPTLVAALAHDDARVRKEAGSLLIEARYRAVPGLLAALGQADDRLRDGAVEVLGGMGALPVADLVTVASGQDARAADAAARALVQVGEPAVKPLLAACAAHPSVEAALVAMKQETLAALKNLSVADLPLLMAALGLQEAELRNQASKRLAELGSPAVSTLMEALTADAERLAEGAAHTLAAIGQPALEPLVAALGDAGREAEVAATLARIAELDERYIDQCLAGLSTDSAAHVELKLARMATQQVLLRALGREPLEETVAQGLSLVLQSITGGNSGATAQQLLPLVMDGLSIGSLIMGLQVEGWPAGPTREALDEVEAGLRGILRLDSGLAVAHCWLGDMHAIRGRVREAIACYERSLELGPPLDVDMPRPIWQGVQDAADRQAREEGRMRPALPIFSPWEDNAEAKFHFRLGMLHMGVAEPVNPWHSLAERNETNEALPPHQRDAAHYRSAVPRFQKALDLGLLIGKVAGAEIDLENALGFCAWAASGGTLEACEWEQTLELVRLAERSFERFLTHSPGSPGAARAQDLLNVVRERRARYEAAGTNQALWQFERGERLLSMDKHEEARAAFRSSVQEGLAEVRDRVEGQLRAWLETDDRQAKAIAADVLIQLSESAVESRPDDMQAHQQLAELYLAMVASQADPSTLDKALLHAEKAVALGADRARFSGPIAGAAYKAARDYLREGEHLERVLPLIRKGVVQAEIHLQANPDDEQTARRADEMREMLADLAEADGHEAAFLQRQHGLMLMATIAAAREVQKLAPSVGVQADIVDGTRHARAVGAYREAIRLKPDYARARHELSEVYAQEGRYREAADLLAEGIRMSPDYWRFYFSLGDIQFQQLDEPKAAAETYRQGLALNPTWAAGHASLGAACMALGQFDQVLVHTGKALELDPQIRGAHLGLAVAHLAKGNIEAGTRAFAVAIGENPENIDFYLALLQHDLGENVERLAEQGRSAEALRLLDSLTAPLEVGVRSRSKAAEIARAYGLLSTRYGPLMNTFDLLEGYDASIRLLERGLEIDSSVRELRTLLAVITSDKGRHFARKGRYREGLTWAQRAIDIDSSEVAGWQTAMMCYQKLGDSHNMMKCIEQLARMGDVQAMQFLRDVRGY